MLTVPNPPFVTMSDLTVYTGNDWLSGPGVRLVCVRTACCGKELLRVGNVYRQLHEAQNRERKRRRPASNGGNGGAPAEEAVIWRQVTEEG